MRIIIFRRFIRIIFLGFLCLIFIRNSFGQDSIINYPFKTLSEAFNALGFNPGLKGNAFFVVTADVHYGNPEGDGMISVIEDINQMHIKPAFFCIAGDMIIHASSHFGAIPDEKDYQLAVNEFRHFKSDAEKLDKQVALKLVLGNHDTHPQETEPEIFWKVFPGYPPYQSMDIEDIHHIFLNGHSTGYIDSVQMQWLKNDIRSIPGSQTVIIFIHQPSMGSRVGERGIPEAISKAFRKHRGQIWLIAGHSHNNFQEIFQCKNTKLTEHGITCGADGIWGGPEKPGYWIYCLNNGQVAGRIFKQRTKGYRLEPAPDLSQARSVPMPFDNCTNIVWKYLIEKRDSKYLVEAKDSLRRTWVHHFFGNGNYLIEAEAENCLNYWAYVKSLTYRLPLKDTKNTASTIAMLTNHRIENADKPDQYFISSDLQNWQQIPLKKAKSNENLLIFSIPQSFREDENVYFKFIPAGETSVGGFALIK